MENVDSLRRAKSLDRDRDEDLNRHNEINEDKSRSSFSWSQEMDSGRVDSR